MKLIAEMAKEGQIFGGSGGGCAIKVIRSADFYDCRCGVKEGRDTERPNQSQVYERMPTGMEGKFHRYIFLINQLPLTFLPFPVRHPIRSHCGLQGMCDVLDTTFSQSRREGYGAENGRRSSRPLKWLRRSQRKTCRLIPLRKAFIVALWH